MNFASSAKSVIHEAANSATPIPEGKPGKGPLIARGPESLQQISVP
jgi:hypothetical protein